MNGPNAPPVIDRAPRRALVTGVIVLAVCAVGGVAAPGRFFQSYLVAYLYWVGLGLGSLALLMLHHLVGGQWGMVIRRPLEAGTRTLPFLLLLFAPVIFGMHELYVWTHEEHVAADQALQEKSAYLNTPFFLARAGVYFAVWLLLAYFLNRWSRRQDETGEGFLAGRLRALSGPGLVLYGLTVTFASIDWVMSLEPHWFSTIYGMLFMIGQGLAALAFVIIVLMLAADHEPLAGFVKRAHFHDLGNLLLAFVMLWAYVSFAQYLIIWSANLPEEIPWYLTRMGPAWQYVALVLLLLHFAVPFVLLLNRPVKKGPRALAVVAAGLLLLRWLDLYWYVAPTFQGREIHFHWLDVAVPIGLGGVWLGLFFWQLKGRALLPVGDPGFQQAVSETKE